MWRARRVVVWVCAAAMAAGGVCSARAGETSQIPPPGPGQGTERSDPLERVRGRPRLVVTGEQLPALRARAATPGGRALLEQIAERIGQDRKHTACDDAVAHGFLYALTGEAAHADEARRALEAWIEQPGSGPTTGGRAAVAALAYDLIYDACEPPFRRRMHAAIEASYPRIRDMTDVRPNPSISSNFNARWRPALGLMALAVLHEPDVDPARAREMLAFAVEHVDGYLQEAIGEGGWGVEGDHYTAWSLRAVLPFVHAWRNATGEPLTDAPGLGAFLPMCTARTVFREGDAFLPSLGVGRSGLYFHRDLLAMAWPLVPPDQQPAVLWHWQRIAELPPGRAGLLDTLSPGAAVYQFLHYPLDLAPADPADALPRAWTDAARGVYLFRNRWRDGDDLLAVFHAKHPPVGGGWRSANAGVFRIYGLGGPWIVQGPGGKVGHWEADNAVLDASVPPATRGGTRVAAPTTHLATGQDGSATLTVDLSEMYAAPARRAFAVDYSGLSGAAGLYALWDRMMEGDAPRTWQVWTAGEVRIEGNRFVLSRPGQRATLVGTFLAPADVELRRTPAFGIQVTNPTDRSGRTVNQRTRGMSLWPNQGREVAWRLEASGGDEFLVVMTLQEGEPPEVSVAEGADGLRVTVGGRTLRFGEDGIAVGSMRPLPVQAAPEAGDAE